MSAVISVGGFMRVETEPWCFLPARRLTAYSFWPSAAGVPMQELALTTAAHAKRASKVNYITK